MNTNSISSNIASALSMEQELADTLAVSLVNIIREQIQGGNSVAVPGFGQFDVVNKPEQIVTDLSTGKRLMLPPVIEIVFKPATDITNR